MKKILGLVFVLSIISCSSLPTKEVQLAKSELDKAKASDGPVLAEKDYKDAELSYQSAEGFLTKKEGDKAKEESVKSLEKSRTVILTLKDKRTDDQIQKVEKMLTELKKQYGIDAQFKADDLSEEAKNKLELMKRIKPAEDLLTEAKKLYKDGKDLVPGIQKNIKTSEPIKELDQYIDFMDKSFNKAKESEVILNQEFEKLKRIQEINSMMTKGEEIVNALQKDPFVSQFYPEDRQKVIADYLVLKKAITDKNEADIEKNKGAYKNLTDFFDKMSAEKLALNNNYREITDKMLSKIKGYYKQDAESYLEKATRLREEVYKVYGKNLPAGVQQVKPNNIKNKAEVIELKPVRIEQNAKDESEEITPKDEEEIKQELKTEEKKPVEEVKQESKETQEVKEEPKKELKDEAKEESKEEVKAEKTNNPEQMLLNKMENLYNDAEALYAKEDYSDSIEKAKETIDLAQKMLALKKGLDGKTSQKQSDDAGFNSEEIYGSLKVEFKKYTIKKGDCLWKIAMNRKLYGKAYLWPFIWYANKKIVTDPDKIEPKTVLQVPIFKK